MVDGEHPDADLEPRQVPDGNRTLPYETLLELLSEPRIIKGEFSSTTVPDRLMQPPIQCAAEWLYQHGRRCRNPKTCSLTPGPLRTLLKMRKDAITGSAERIHAVLWLHPDTAMVRQVRQMIHKNHQELAGAVVTGDILAPDRLRTALGQGGDKSAELLAAVLWADGLDDGPRRELFRLLPVFLTQEQVSMIVPEPETTSEEPSEKPRHRAKRLGLQDRVKDLEKQLSDSRANVRSRSKDLKRATDTIQTLETERDALKATVEQLENQSEDLSASARTVKTQLQESERISKQASKTSEAYRIDLERTRGELTEAEKERSALVRRLAAARASIQDLEAQMRAIPRDQDAIDDWLQREESRLRTLELVVQGGARERVLEEKRLRRKLESAFREAYPQFKQPRPPALDSTRSVKFVALGGGNEVGRSAYMVSIGIHDVLIDCGIAVGASHREKQIPDLSTVTRLDALLVTHAHTDHVGWIPALVASFEDFPIYCTKPTAELLPLMLRDSRAHYERRLAQAQIQRTLDPRAPIVAEDYSRDDIFEAETRLLEARVGEATGIAATDLTATFFPAGHILGAASILLEGGGRRVVISGDLGPAHQHTVSPFNIPDNLGEVDLLVLESTYGASSRPQPSVAEGELVSFVSQTITHGIALLPCFALGRAQEVLAILKSARRAGRLPHNLKVLTDGMINKINPIYMEHAKLEPGDFIEVGGQLDRDMAIQGAISAEMTPTVVVTTSGMLTGGPVIEWAQRLLPDPRHRMALLGYQDEGAPGGLLKKLVGQDRPPYSVTLHNQEGLPLEVTVAARVKPIGLSAHADQDGLVAYAAAVRPKRIVLVHGDDDARSTLRERLIRDGVCQDVELAQTLQIP
jgi:Cft2 family RNA processing exonuclease